MKVKASEIATFLGRQLVGPDFEINKPSSAFAPDSNSVVFAKKYSPDLLAQLNCRSDILVIAGQEFQGKITVSHIISDRPRLDFARVLQRFFSPERPTGLAPTAVVAPTAKIGREVYIGNFTVIEDDVEIGDGTIIRDHVVIRKKCVIGKRCLIKSNTVIGEEGFGFEYDENGVPFRIPHIGRVVIGDNVEIGSLNVIARGTLEDTIIENSVKTDDHVFIAHNVRIGENSVVIAGAEISGSVRVGKNVWIAPQATIINKVEVGDYALVGIGAVVTKSVEPNMIVAGNPARVLRTRNT
ncbi:hypothetical protein SY88_11530 [Clostridiales bacterium PH28_bin88]|nr:hypothetical protein SY88_11530 [Clostridiales bacterium PH28_bin88]